MRKEELRERVREAPDSPGVYFFKDRRGKVIYVGKARSLRERLSSYLNPPTPKVAQMLREAASLEWLVFPGETEALLAEASFIRFQNPKFNVRLKGGEHYPYIKITSEAWPRILVTRKLVEDGGRYFGPYPDARAARKAVLAVRLAFPIRPCGYKLPSPRAKLCIYYYLGRCPGPCEGKISQEEYLRIVQGAVKVLEGKAQELVEELSQRMKRAAEDLNFELAAQIRDQLRALAKISGVKSAGEGSLDLVVIGEKAGIAGALVMAVREGRLAHQERYALEGRGAEPQELAYAFVREFYTSRPPGSGEIVCQPLPAERELLEEALSRKAGFSVKIRAPKPSERDLLQLAQRALEAFLEEELAKKPKREHPGLRELRELLGLPQLELIFAFDVSHFSGKETVGSAVAFKRGKPAKRLYRRFRIRGVSNDDPAAMRQLVLRRMRRALEEGELPDLVLVDGGITQLSAALEAMEELGVEIPTLALAKRYEELYSPDGEVYALPGRSEALKLLMRIRDEAHRFAVSYHRHLRDARLSVSALDGIEGLGPKKKRELLKFFGSVERIKAASPWELQQVPGIGPKLAEKILKALREG